MSTKKKNGQNMLQWIIPTAILVIIILFTLTSYKSDIFTREKNKKLDEYSSKAREMADYYSSEIYMIGQVARMLSTRVSVDRDYFCDDNVDLLTSAVSQLNIDAGYIVRNDGKVMNNLGVEAPSLKAATNGDISVEGGNIDGYIVSSSGDCVHYVSASFAGGSVILKYTPKHINELEQFLNSNAKTSTYVLISSMGIVIDSAGVEAGVFKEGMDLFDYLDGASYAGITKKDEFLNNLEQQVKGKVLITNKGGVPKYFIYQPISDYKTFLMIIVDEKQVDQAAEKGIASTTEMFWKIVILILIFVAILVVISIINATNYRKANRELKEQAETDLLTDLYNKVATENKIKEYLANEGKNKKSIMFVLDIDNFKKINDTMGHAFGDEVLSTLGHQLKSEFRINDIIGRTGGDEFIILLKDLKDDAALTREANRVATFFKNFKVGEYTKYSATASIGVVEIPNDGTDFDTLYKQADKALYLAKKRGKNQMAFYKDTKDIKIEPDEPVLKVVEEKPKTVAEPPKEIEKPPKPGEVDVAYSNIASVASVSQVAALKEAAAVSQTSSEPEAVKKEVQAEKKEPAKKEPLPTVRDIFSAKNEIPETVEKKAVELKPAVKKAEEPGPAVKKAEEPRPAVKKAEVPKPAGAVQPQKKVVKKVVKRVVKKPEEVNPAAVKKPEETSQKVIRRVVKKVVRPEDKKAEAPNPAVKKAEPPKPEVKKAENPKPEVKKAEEPKSAVKKAEPPKPAVKKAEPPKPEVKKAEDPKPAVKKAEPPKPEVKKAEAPKPEPKPEGKFSFFN